jgi:Ca-activated chloride channel family protein
MRSNLRLFLLALVAVATLLTSRSTHAAGMLTPAESDQPSPEILAHDVRVQVLDGFARTEVEQRFHNPSDRTLEAVYTCPVPTDGSLSELTIRIGDRVLSGEVLARSKAASIYEEQKAAGGDAALATQEGYESYTFKVANIPAGGEVQVRFVYYQPLAIDTGVGRYVYPLAEGGNESAARAFWKRDPKLHGPLTFEVDLRASWPVDDVRLAGHEQDSSVKRFGEGRYEVALKLEDASLDRDLVLYYRLRDGLPGRVELIPYRAHTGGPGTFMLVLTPGVDLPPITTGVDYCFVLDTSGSMAPHLHTIADGVTRSLAHLDPKDRFRIVIFNNSARELTDGWRSATPQEVEEARARIAGLTSDGGTDLHAGLSRGLETLSDERATNVILITDGVANQGIVDPREFQLLMARSDLRVFAFVVGGEANWPLMRIIGDASGGLVAGVSDADDVLGQVTLAKEKVGYEALHDVDLSIRGVRTFDTSANVVGKVYRGQQLVLLGRYDRGGVAKVVLQATLTGEDRRYETTVRFPDVAEDLPELERLWALQRIQALSRERDLGLGDGNEVDEAIAGLGIEYQLVTEQTAMLVLDDQEFERRGIARANLERTNREASARQARDAQAPVSRRADAQQPMFDRPAASAGGGAMEPWMVVVGLILAMLVPLASRRRSSARC